MARKAGNGKGAACSRIWVVFLLSAAAGVQTPLGWNVTFGHASFENAQSMAMSQLRKGQSASPKTPAEARARLMAALGAFPPRTPLNAKRTGVLEREGYTVEKIIFESRPRYYVTANVYVPRRSRPPFPAVLSPVGHWGTGKAYEDYQRLAIYLARRGFLVMVYDLPGQGERLLYYDSVMGRSLPDPGTSEYYVTIEHGIAVGHTFLVSGNLAGYMVWDGIRALDYLFERSDVDRERIACTGTSGGGLQTELLSAVDERIKVSIPVSYGGCAADHPDNEGLTMADVDALIAPRPLLMMNATGDSRSSVTGKRKRHETVAGVYQALGAGERTQFLIGEGRHGYLQPLRESAYRWLSRWLRGAEPEPGSYDEPPTSIEADMDLAATETGQVRSSLGGETILSANRAAAAAIRSRVPAPVRPDELAAWRERMKKEVAERLRLPAEASPLNPQVIGRIDKGDYTLEKLVYYSQPEVYIPALLLLPKKQGPSPAVLFVNDAGKSADGLPEGYLEPLARAGYVVLAIDPRGMGETAPSTEAPYNRRDYRGFSQDSEVDLFYAALRAGRTILGLRVLDVLRGVDYLETRAEADRGRISVIGHGAGGLFALYAAALDSRVHSAACTRTLVTYSSILESDLYAHRYSGFAPGALQAFDLPDLAAMAAPRPLLLLNPVDQRQERIGSEAAAASYARAGSVCQQADSAGEAVEQYLRHLKR